LCIVERRRLRLEPFWNVVATVMGQAQLFEPDEHIVGAVAAIVGIDDKVGKPDS